MPGYWTTVRTEDVADTAGTAEARRQAAKRKPARGDRGQFIRKPEGDAA